MLRPLDVASSVLTTLGRLASGSEVGRLGARPDQLLELYDFEGCPYCRKVREALSILDLDARVRPCPKGGRRFRPLVREREGREQFPYLVDPETGKGLFESDDIVAYLFARYGDGRVPWRLAPGVLTDASSALAGLPRLGAGVFASPSREPARPLELWSFEASPFCRIVREALCRLELPYVLHNVARGSPRRDAFVERSGRMQVPWLVDPNRDVQLFESAEIVAYLEDAYGV